MTHIEIVPMDFFGEPTGDYEVRVYGADAKYGYTVVGMADSTEAAAALADKARKETGAEPAPFAAGDVVTFRDDFSDDLRGLTFEISTFEDGAIAHIEAETHRQFVTLRRRVGKRQRWAYRLAYASDLVAAS